MDGGFKTSQEHPVRVEVVHHLIHQGHVQRPLAGGEQTTVKAAGRVPEGVQDDVKSGGRKPGAFYKLNQKEIQKFVMWEKTVATDGGVTFW